MKKREISHGAIGEMIDRGVFTLASPRCYISEGIDCTLKKGKDDVVHSERSAFSYDDECAAASNGQSECLCAVHASDAVGASGRPSDGHGHASGNACVES